MEYCFNDYFMAIDAFSLVPIDFDFFSFIYLFIVQEPHFLLSFFGVCPFSFSDNNLIGLIWNFPRDFYFFYLMRQKSIALFEVANEAFFSWPGRLCEELHMSEGSPEFTSVGPLQNSMLKSDPRGKSSKANDIAENNMT